jgi:7-keto-8-aminopelargonate synthetase-like enzyme
VLRAARDQAESEGLNLAGSRVTTGNHPLHRQLEAQAAAFLGAEEAALCPDGFLSNTVALETIAEEFQRFFIVESAHASLQVPADCLPRDRVHRFRHADPEGLRQALEAHLRPRERPLVLTNGVEPGDGELAPLGAYWGALRDADGFLLVDDAHGMGTAGPTGKGSPEAAQLPAEAFLQTGTFAKALGAFGGLVAGPSELFARIVARSRTFTGATPMPPPLAAAACCAIGLLQEHPAMITDLQQRTLQARERLRALGLPSCPSPVPILSVTHHDEARNQRLRELLLENGIYPPLIDYPGSPQGGHFRFTLSGLHTGEEVERLLATIALSCE